MAAWSTMRGTYGRCRSTAWTGSMRRDCGRANSEWRIVSSDSGVISKTLTRSAPRSWRGSRSLYLPSAPVMFQDLKTAHQVAPHALKGVLELAVARVGRGIGLRLPRLRGLVAGGRPEGINPAIAGLIHGNGELAAEFYQGRYLLTGSVVEAGSKGIFETPLPSLAAYRELHGFGWLAHLKAAGRELDRAHGRALFQDWIDRQCYRMKVARDIEVRARRMISLVQNGGFLTAGAPSSFATGFYASLGRQARSLYAAPQTGLRPPERLQTAIALAYAAVGLTGLEGMSV